VIDIFLRLAAHGFLLMKNKNGKEKELF